MIDKNNVVRGCEQGLEYYDQSFLDHEHWRSHYTESRYYPLWTVIADRITKAGVMSVLDIGCGPGQLASLLRDKGLPKYLGIDFSPKRVEQARKVCPEFDFVLADVLETQLFYTYIYNAIICSEFLEHVERDKELLDRIHSGTRFYGTVPNFPHCAHVRHFENALEVFDRYQEYFQEFSVSEHPASLRGQKFFLMEGYKR